MTRDLKFKGNFSFSNIFLRSKEHLVFNDSHQDKDKIPLITFPFHIFIFERKPSSLSNHPSVCTFSFKVAMFRMYLIPV